MHRLTIIGLLVAAVGLATAITSLRADAGTAPARHAEGRTIWLRDCSVCHGADGSGGHGGPDIRDSGAASVDFMVTTGRMPLPSQHAKMIRRTSPYSSSQQRALVDYVSTLVTGPEIPHVRTSASALGAGGSAFRQNCATCHQTAGSGGALALGYNAPSLAQATPTQVVEAMRTGPGAMPVFGPQSLSPKQADAIATYVQTLRHPADPGGTDLGHLGPVPEGLIAWVFGLGAMILITRLLGRRRASR